MKIREIWIGAVSAILGGILTVTVTHFSTRDIQERRLSYEARKAAYADLFQATALSRQDTIGSEFRLLWDTGRLQIGVFSDGAVVEKLAKYLRHFGQPVCDDKSKFEDDVATYQAIRREMKTRGAVTNADLALVLFGCRLEE